MQLRTSAPLALLALGGTLLLPGVAAAAPPGEQQASVAHEAGVDQHPFTVPADVCEIAVEVHGASGGGSDAGSGTATGGGRGATVTATLAVAPGQVLHLVPGGRGADRLWGQQGPVTSGFNQDPGGPGGANGGGRGGNAGAYWLDGDTPRLVGGAGGGGDVPYHAAPERTLRTGWRGQRRLRLLPA